MAASSILVASFVLVSLQFLSVVNLAVELIVSNESGVSAIESKCEGRVYDITIQKSK